MICSIMAFAMLCSHWFNCTDFDETLVTLSRSGSFMPEDEPYGNEAQNALYACVNHLHNQMQKDKPWKINEEFIFDLGFKFGTFRIINTQYLTH